MFHFPANACDLGKKKNDLEQVQLCLGLENVFSSNI